ncbi:MAG: hypothetical protein AAGH15_28860, partial [Myxococcota bacterium]
MRRTLLGAALLLALASPSGRAQTPRDPVEIDVGGLFGDELFVQGAHHPLLITLRNRTAQPLRGALNVSVRSWREGGQRHRLPIDLPARAERRVRLPVHAGDGGEVRVSLVGAGGTLGRTTYGLYGGSTELIVLLADPPRLRGPLLDLGEVESTDRWGSIRRVQPSVGVVPMDPTTGDPLAPRAGQAWDGVRLVVAQAPLLERLGEVERRALEDYLVAGGRLLVFPRSEADLEGPFVRSLFGALRAETLPRRVGPPMYVPAAVADRRYV